MSTRGRPLIYPWQPRILGLKPRVFDVKPWVLQKTLRFFKPVANPWFRPPRSIYILIDVLKFFSGKYGSESRIYGQIYMRYMQQIRFGKDPSKSWQEKRSTENPCFPKTQDFHNKTEVLQRTRLFSRFGRSRSFNYMIIKYQDILYKTCLACRSRFRIFDKMICVG